jgi:Mlc titration factor MtfA (ptsG expression regulator)
MDNFEKFLIFLWGSFFIYLFIEVYKFYKYKKKLKSLKKHPLDEKYKKYLQNIPLYYKLNDNDRKIIEYKIQRFWLEKNFIPVYLSLNDEMKTLIAFFGCILTLKFEEYCYPLLEYIYIYPNVIKKSIKREYIVEEDIIISGEALKNSIIISWHEAIREIKKNSKRNVIIHEFAHILDFEDGLADGTPPLDKTELKNWKKYILSEFKKLKHSHHLFIDEYALTNEAEFFAVISEYYFMHPKTLKIHYPDIYEELKRFYKIDTYKLLEKN